MRVVSLVLCVALLAGCFGYNSSAKGWSYVGDAILIAGGAAAAAYDVTENKRSSRRCAAARSSERC